MSTRTILTLVRHGETTANVEGIWHGSIDTQLTERGLREAEQVGRDAAFATDKASLACALGPR